MSWMEDAAISSSLICYGYLVGIMVGSAIGQPLASIPIMLVFFSLRGRLASL